MHATTRRMADVESSHTGFICQKSVDPVLHRQTLQLNSKLNRILDCDFQHVGNRELFWLFDILRQQ